MKVLVHRPCVDSWFTISATSRAFASSERTADAFTSAASCAPSAVTGALGPVGTVAAAGRWCDGFVFVTSWKPYAASARRPEPWQLGQVAELPPSALPMRPSPPHIRQSSPSMGPPGLDPACAGRPIRSHADTCSTAGRRRRAAPPGRRPCAAPRAPLQSRRRPPATDSGGLLLDALGRLADRLDRDSRDRFAADGCLPASARRVEVAGTGGWIYPVESPQGDRFRMFLWFDGGAYQVKVVDPDLGHVADPHACHLFPDARLCLGGDPAGGMPTLEGAFARSVLWAAGFAAWRRTGRFPL